MKKFEVWYMRPEWFREGIMGVLPDKHRIAETHIYLKDVEAADKDQVYGMMQAHKWSPNGEACRLIDKKGLSHTSLSVGDLIVDGTDIWVCAACGWSKLD